MNLNERKRKKNKKNIEENVILILFERTSFLQLETQT